MSLGARRAVRATAGAPVTLTAVGTPVTFRGERQVAPLLNLVSASNIDISSVDLQVWSGSAPWGVLPTHAAPRPALLGLGALCLLMWFRLGRAAHPLPAPSAANSLWPQPDLQTQFEQAGHTNRSDETPAQTAPVLVTASPSQASRVVASLRDVLMTGLAVPTELDAKRRYRSRRSTG